MLLGHHHIKIYCGSEVARGPGRGSSSHGSLKTRPPDHRLGNFLKNLKYVFQLLKTWTLMLELMICGVMCSKKI